MIELSNGIQALLVSNLDQKKQKAACSCCVQARKDGTVSPGSGSHGRWVPSATRSCAKVLRTIAPCLESFQPQKWADVGTSPTLRPGDRM